MSDKWTDINVKIPITQAHYSAHETAYFSHAALASIVGLRKSTGKRAVMESFKRHIVHIVHDALDFQFGYKEVKGNGGTQSARIEQLEREVERLKCCGNCGNHNIETCPCMDTWNGTLCDDWKPKKG